MAVKFWSDKRSQVEAWSAVSPMQVVDSCLVCFMQSGSLVSSVFAKKCLHRLLSILPNTTIRHDWWRSLLT